VNVDGLAASPAAITIPSRFAPAQQPHPNQQEGFRISAVVGAERSSRMARMGRLPADGILRVLEFSRLPGDTYVVIASSGR
jgi:hypothetical protein